MIPTLRVIRELPSKSKAKMQSIRKLNNGYSISQPTLDTSVDIITDDECEEENNLSTYKTDFTDLGIDVCMAKAYHILTLNKNKNISSVDNLYSSVA